MHRLLAALAALAIAGSAAFAQCHDAHAPGGLPPAVLMEGMGHLHHPVTTSSAEAQKFFDQGLTFVYAFNHEEAVSSFERAAALDPSCAMAYWGVALALGPNINLDVNPEREAAAYGAVHKAMELATKVSEPERAYVEALAKRYSNDPKADLRKLAVDYKNAMADVMRRYPDDLDAATLYAESAMDLSPWRLWSNDGKPAEATEEIAAVLESVLKRDPDHVGANHYYIHVMEASPHPERALPSAARLTTLVPAAGHLVHMPAHIYMRTGDFAAAARANEQAILADAAYVKARSATGVYPLMYFNHNYHFLAAAYGMEGRGADAVRAADALYERASPMAAEMPMFDFYMPMYLYQRVRAGRWDDIMALKEPSEKLPLTRAIWHYARGVAAAAKGDLATAKAERAALESGATAVPAEAMSGGAAGVVKLAGQVLDARIAKAEGDRAREVELWRAAVATEDALGYDEPPDWYYPVRESLGGALLRAGMAVDAERVFRDDLERNPRNGRSLFGLVESLKAQGKTASVAAVRPELDAAWKDADVKLTVDGL